MENDSAPTKESAENIFTGLQERNNWFVVDQHEPSIEKGNVHSFATQKEAMHFIRTHKEEPLRLFNAESVTDLLEQAKARDDFKSELSQLNTSTMNLQNAGELRTTLIKLGFEDSLYQNLLVNLEKGEKAFTLTTAQVFQQDQLQVEIHFRKRENEDRYDLSRYKATLQKPGEEPRSQNFFFGKGNAVTDTQQAYNLLDGRSVLLFPTNKTGQEYEAWHKLDFDLKDEYGNYHVKQYHKNYGFEPANALNKVPLPPMEAQQIRDMMTDLYRGNLHAIQLATNSPGTTYYLSANPQFKSIDIYGADKKLLSKTQVEQLTNPGNLESRKITPTRPVHTPAPSMGHDAQAPEKKNEKIQKQQTGNSPELKKAKAKDLKTAKTAALLPKKRSDRHKGLSI